MMNSDRYEKSLAATGLGVGDIDFVMCTHLHVDHVGWNTRLENGRWVPTFPKARYVFADRELEYWTKRHKDDPAACPVDDGFRAADRGRQPRRHRQEPARPQRPRHPDPDARPHHRPLLGACRQARRRRRHHRRHDPLAAAGALSGVRHDVGLRFRRRPAVSRRELFGRFCDTSTLMCTAHFPSPSRGRFVAGFRCVRLQGGVSIAAPSLATPQGRQSSSRTGASFLPKLLLLGGVFYSRRGDRGVEHLKDEITRDRLPLWVQTV